MLSSLLREAVTDRFYIYDIRLVSVMLVCACRLRVAMHSHTGEEPVLRRGRLCVLGMAAGTLLYGESVYFPFTKNSDEILS